MAAIVAPGICRFTVNAVANGRPVANIIDMRVDTTGAAISREQAVFNLAGDIINNWDDHVMTLTTNQYTAQSVSWVDLDAADASVGERSVTSDTSWPKVGRATGGTAQGNVAYRVNKVGGVTRGQRRGRMYLPCVSEDANLGTNGNLVNPTFVGYVNDAMGEFLSGVNDNEVPGRDYASYMVVVHLIGDTFESTSDVEQLICDPTFGSQRRRLRG